MLQLVDDLLDFVSCEALMGKPTAADLRLGLATAPVLFAAQQVSKNTSSGSLVINLPGSFKVSKINSEII